MLLRAHILHLLLLSILLVGCGGSFLDDPVGQLGTDTSSRVTHQNWGSYRLYRFEAGTWHRIVDLGQPTEPLPLLNERPVLIVHGLGANFETGLLDPLAASLLSNGATSIFGFEYDSLDSIAVNGTYLSQALQYLTGQERDRSFRIVAHSMGALVTRAALESGLHYDMAPTGNRVSLVAGPHLGSEVAGKLQKMDLNIVEEAIAQLVLNGELVFTNADGQPVDTRGDEISLQQLSLNSDFLNTLNFEASNKHPQFVYRTIAGSERGTDYEAFNRVLGVFADDGLVNVESANAAVIGPVQTVTVPYDHSEIILAQASLLVVLDQLGLLP